MGSLPKSKRSAVHAEADATFAALDIDDNGDLDLAELETHFAGVEGPAYSPLAVERIFNTLDNNGNGKISLLEFRRGYTRYRAFRLALSRRPQPEDLSPG